MKNNNSIIIAVDFDGTCVTHEFPNVGKDIGAAPVLKKLVEAGHKLILWTMRSNVDDLQSRDLGDRQYLTDAVEWFKARGIPLWGIQTNPEQLEWTTSPKAYAQLYIDDAALGCPLVTPKGERPYANWGFIEQLLEGRGYLERSNIGISEAPSPTTGIFSQQKDGSLIPATPLKACCEWGEAKGNGFCENSDIKDYVRLENDKDGSSWDSEPIGLCQEHASGHQLWSDT
jgi:hypothetical protein